MGLPTSVFTDLSHLAQPVRKRRPQPAARKVGTGLAAYTAKRPFDLASCGLIGLESCLGVVKKVLVDDEDLGLMEMIKLLTVSPRKIMGFDNDLLKKGKEAELVLFNEDEKWVFNRNDINSKSKNSPFIGAQLSGKVIHTISKGVITTN